MFTVAPTNPFYSMGKPSSQNTSQYTKKHILRMFLLYEDNFVYLMHYLSNSQLLEARDLMG